MDPLLTERGLAALLKVDEGLVARLLVESDLPRLQFAGELRFVTEDVISWLRQQRGVLLAPETIPGDAVEVSPTALSPASANEQPFVESNVLRALGVGAGNPKANDHRAQLREILLGLGQGINETLSRLSRGRLGPDEAQPTSPWKVEGPDAPPIESMTMYWKILQSRPSGFSAQPHISLTLNAHEVSLALRVPEGIDPPVNAAVRNLKASGAEMGYGVEDGSWLAAYRYPFAERAPTLLSLRIQLEADLERLVPLWDRVAAQVNG
jgi:hypothetical protein